MFELVEDDIHMMLLASTRLNQMQDEIRRCFALVKGGQDKDQRVWEITIHTKSNGLLTGEPIFQLRYEIFCGGDLLRVQVFIGAMPVHTLYDHHGFHPVDEVFVDLVRESLPAVMSALAEEFPTFRAYLDFLRKVQ